MEGGTFNYVAAGAGTNESTGPARFYGNAKITQSGGASTLTFSALDYLLFTDPRGGLDVSGTADLGVSRKLIFTGLPSGFQPKFLVGDGKFGAYNATNGIVEFTGYSAAANVGASAFGDVLRVDAGFGADDISFDRTLRGLAITDPTARNIGASGTAANLTVSSGGILAAGGVTHVLSAPRLNFVVVTPPSMSTLATGNVISVGDTSRLAVGQVVSGANIPGNSFITEIINGTSFRINNNTATAGSGNVLTAYAPGYFNVASNTTLDLQGAVVSNSDVIKVGAGTLLVSAKQYYGGQTTILEGTLKLAAGNNTLFGGAGNILNVERNGTLDLNGNLLYASRLRSLGTQAGAGGVITNSSATPATFVVGKYDLGFYGSVQGANVSFASVAGSGTLSLSSLQTYGGTTFISGNRFYLRDEGELRNTSAINVSYGRIDVNNGDNSNVQLLNRLNDAAPISLYGGYLSFNGLVNTYYSERLGALSLLEGDSDIRVTGSGSAFWRADLLAPSLTRSVGTTVNFAGSGRLGQPEFASRIIFDTPLVPASRGLIGAWAIVNNEHYAAYNPVTGVGIIGDGGFAGYDADFGAGKFTQLVAQPDVNASYGSNAVTTLAAGPTTAAVLRFAGDAHHQLAFASSSDVLTLGHGGVLRSANNRAVSVGTTAVRGGLTSSLPELIVYSNNTATQTFTGASSNAVALGSTTMSLDAVGGVAGIYPGMTVTDGTVSFNRTNGSPTISGGNTFGLAVGMPVFGAGIPGGATILSITNATTFVLSANTTSNQNGTALTFSSGIVPGTYVKSVDTVNNTVELSTASTATNNITAYSFGASNVILNSVLQDAAVGSPLTYVKAGPGIQVLTAANTYTGGTIVNSGDLHVNPTGAATVVIPAGGIVLNGGWGGQNFAAIYVNASGAVAASNAVTINGSGRFAFAQYTVNELASVTFNNRGGEYAGSQLSYLNVGVNSLLTLSGATPFTATSNNPYIISEVANGRVILTSGAKIFDIDAIKIPGIATPVTDVLPTLNISSIITGTGVSVTKTGNGLLQLSGQNEFTGGLTVSAGGLVVGASSTPVQGGNGILGGPLGTGTVSMAVGTRLLVGQGSYAVGNAISFAGVPLFDARDTGAARTLTLNGTITGLPNGTPEINIASPWVTVALRGVIPNIANITAFNKTGLGALVFNAAGYAGAFNATALGNSSSVSLLHDGSGNSAPEAIILPGAVVFDEGIVPNIVVDRAGGTLPYGQAANKTIQAASISNLNLGLVVTNLNSYGLVVADAFSPAAGVTYQVANATQSMFTPGLRINGKISGSNGLTKTGDGTLALGNAANDFTGDVVVNRGALAISADGQLGARSKSTRLNSSHSRASRMPSSA
jgi:autotransporter-associated beta strand protein